VLVAALITAALGIVALGLSPTDVFFSCDGGSKFILASALNKRDANWPALPYPGRNIDPEGRFFPIRDEFSIEVAGDYYSAFPVYFPMLSALWLTLFGFRGLFAIPLAAAFVGLVLFGYCGRALGWSPRWQQGGVALLALATPFGFYAMTFWEHVPAAALFLGALMLLAPTLTSNGRTPLRRSWAGAGVLLGVATVLRPEYLWIAIALAANMFLPSLPDKRLRSRAGYIVGGYLTVLLLFIWANFTLYGDLLGPQLRANLFATGHSRWEIIKLLIAGENRSGWWSVFALAALAAGVLSHRTGVWLRLGLVSLMGLLVAGMLLTELLPPGGYRSLSGLIETCPFFLVIPWGGVLAAYSSQAQRSTILLGRAAGLAFAGTIATSPVSGGLQGGNRLLLPAIILGLAAVIDGICHHRSERGVVRAWRTLALVALLVSVPLSSRSVAYLLHRKADVDGPALAMLRRSGADAAVFTNSSFPQGLAAAYWEIPFYRIDSVAGLQTILDALGASGKNHALVLSWPNTPTPQHVMSRQREGEVWLRADRAFPGGVYQFDLYDRGRMQNRPAN